MALTRGDKLIILGAVALAATVVLGLAILKRPHLFSSDREPAAVIPPAPTAAMPPVPAAPAAVEPPPAPPSAPPTVTGAVTPPAPLAQPGAAGPSQQAAAPAPAPVATPPAPRPAPTPVAPGDENLERMFAEIASDTPKPGEMPGTPPAGGPGDEPRAAPAPSAESALAGSVQDAKPASPKDKAREKTKDKAKDKTKDKGKSPAEPAPPAKASEMDAAPRPGAVFQPQTPPPHEAAAPAPAKKAESAAPAAKAEAKAKPASPQAAAKPVAGGGSVIRIIAQEKPGEYELVIQTNKPPATFSKMFLTDPPRMVLDIGGAWSYVGPMSSDTGNAFVRHIRVGRHPDMFRVVLDLAPDAPAKLRGAPTMGRVPEGVVLRIPK